jgi:beta-lactamase class A
MGEPTVTRRAFLGAAALFSLVGCGDDKRTPAAASPAPAPIDTTRLRRLERRFDARLGVYAVNTGTGEELAYRSDERFAFCSTFKGLAAAAVLDRNPLSDLDTVVRYTEADLMPSSSITRDHVATGLTLRQACDAAIRFSDGTAGNLLLREIGGPAGLTKYVRSLGDHVTRSDRTEPSLAHHTPGDRRDTTHPRAIADGARGVRRGADRRDRHVRRRRPHLKSLARLRSGDGVTPRSPGAARGRRRRDRRWGRGRQGPRAGCHGLGAADRRDPCRGGARRGAGAAGVPR